MPPPGWALGAGATAELGARDSEGGWAAEWIAAAAYYLRPVEHYEFVWRALEVA